MNVGGMTPLEDAATSARVVLGWVAEVRESGWEASWAVVEEVAGALERVIAVLLDEQRDLHRAHEERLEAHKRETLAQIERETRRIVAEAVGRR